MGDYFDILDDLSVALFFVHVVDIVIICNLLDEFVGNFLLDALPYYNKIMHLTSLDLKMFCQATAMYRPIIHTLGIVKPI